MPAPEPDPRPVASEALEGDRAWQLTFSRPPPGKSDVRCKAPTRRARGWANVSRRFWFQRFSGSVPRRGIAGSHGSSTWGGGGGECCSVFRGGCTLLHSHQRGSQVLLSLHPRQHLSLGIVWFSFSWQSHPDVGEVTSHPGFCLHFPDNWRQPCFHIPVDRSYTPVCPLQHCSQQLRCRNNVNARRQTKG